MANSKRLKSISVKGLHEIFNYNIDFPDNGDTVIIIAPNGYGKTALLNLINSCMHFRMTEVAAVNFNELKIIFEDNTSWIFERLEVVRKSIVPRPMSGPRKAPPLRRTRKRTWVKFKQYDSVGALVHDKIDEVLLNLPTEIMKDILERTLPIVSTPENMFRDIYTNEIFSYEQILSQYYPILRTDESFRTHVYRYGIVLNRQSDAIKHCVFIETQRLLLSKKNERSETDSTQGPSEEITRQAINLASLLQENYTSYAAVSQELDRSFPNRLISRAADKSVKDLLGLRADLNSIEERRQELTEAGILVETSEPLVPPRDELLGNVAEALQIYVEDSKTKLGIFDKIFPKVSVFKKIINNKLKPKELLINREFGAEVRRGDKSFGLAGLSSGEKHEFIMLYKLIFDTPENSLVLIDEPEISLHVLWQLEFMPDLNSIQSANKFQSIIATHSPQIFQGVEHLIVDLADQVS